MAKIINLTPHAIKIADEAGNIIREIPPSGTVARVSTTEAPAGEIDGIPAVETQFGEVEGLPEPQEDTVFLVSSLVRSAIPESRTDVLVPDTGPTAVRDEAGRILAVRRFRR
jgi:hypothetical protein